MPLTHRATRVLAGVFLATTMLLGSALGASWWWFRKQVFGIPVANVPAVAEVKEPSPPSPLLVRYQLDLPGRGEIFPALTAGGAKDYWPLAILTITNQGPRPVLQAISAVVEGWTSVSEQTVVIGSSETRSIPLMPEVSEKAYRNHEVRRALLRVRVQNTTGEIGFAQDRPVLLHSGSDLYWGRKFANAQFVARWVTPHDPAILRVVSAARGRVPNGKLNGYNAPRNVAPAAVGAQVKRQVRAVFDALKASGITYVSSMYTFGNHVGEAQRIRLPSETLELQSANCIDVSVAFAAAMENLGINPVIVIVPGHAFAGVRLGRGTQETMYLDLTVLPKGTLEQAISRANGYIRKFKPEEILTVDVAAARLLRIYPLPNGPETQFANNSTVPERTERQPSGR